MAWIKSKADQLAQAAHQQVSAVQQSASKLAGDVLDSVRGPEADVRKDFEFREGPLGFTLEGNLVVAVEPHAQAERLGVAIGDRLVRVDGYEVPPCETGGFEEQRARGMIAKWLKEMPRPGVLTFELVEVDGESGEESPRCSGSEAEGPASGSARSERAKTGAGGPAGATGAAAVLQAELQRIQEERKKLTLELQDAQEERGALAAELEQLRQRGTQSAKRIGELEEQLQSLRAQNKELLGADEELAKLRQATQATEEAHQGALEAAESRAKRAEQGLSSAQEELQVLTSQLKAAEAAAEGCRVQLEPLEKEMRGFREAHEAELELLREEQERRIEAHALEVKDWAQRLEQQQQQQAEEELSQQQKELQRSQEMLIEAQANAEAACVEARAARMEAASAGAGDPEKASSTSETFEVQGLQKRIDLLENRCATLQRRLQSQEPLSPSSTLRPTWELRLAEATGPHVAAVVVAAHRLLLGLLKGFLERLLRSEAWLWVFYAHLLVLYALAASSSVQAGADAGRRAIDSLNAQLNAAGVGGTPARSPLRGG
ncbi:Alpha/beta hydrolase domain-containing protein 17B [Durusdinium trenchii]|uniref:Alpha/beta hydrolase domain-containing protein 17B n=1 Tax=Durusdinium trenchii TaxID=1381693 RepID=A0ABP0N3C6_9DINO